MKILLINPPVYDFSCYDYWLKPLGLLYIAAFLKKNNQNITLFDFMDRHSPYLKTQKKDRIFSTGKYHKKKTDKPHNLKDFYRPFFRYGIERESFIDFIKNKHFQYIFITSMMTYWYLGIREVIDTIREYSPDSKIILGGIYTKLLPEHAKTLNADKIFTIEISQLKDFLNNNTDIIIQESFDYEDIVPDYSLYNNNFSAAILTQIGCPFRCTYCAVGRLHDKMYFFNHDYIIKQLDVLNKLHIKDIAFYDDAILYKQDKHFIPLFERIIKKEYRMRFHFSNGLNVKFVNKNIIDILKQLNIGRIALSIESVSKRILKSTGGKAVINEIDNAIDLLLSAGFSPKNIYGYILSGLPEESIEDVIEAIEYLHKKGIRILMNEFSPVPLTPIYEKYRNKLSDPILTNKSVFSAKYIYSIEDIQNVKNLIKKYNAEIQNE